MSTLTQLRSRCNELGIFVPNLRVASKEPYIEALRLYHWQQQYGDRPLPSQITPMLLSDWGDLDDAEASQLEADQSQWILQPKLDGVRALVHFGHDSIRVTGRKFSEVDYRLCEYQDNLPHLAHGISSLAGTVLDGELVCPKAEIDTEQTFTTTALQAVVAILASGPEKARRIQQANHSRVAFHAFDILFNCGQEVTGLPLIDRLQNLHQVVAQVADHYYQQVPFYLLNKSSIHHNILRTEGEGTVWKRLDQPYRTGQRVKHWVKRKRSLQFQAFVSGFKLGTAGRANESVVGALEFSAPSEDGTVRPIAWVSNWSDQERLAMLTTSTDGKRCLASNYVNRPAIIAGQDIAGRSQRLRHARLIGWC